MLSRRTERFPGFDPQSFRQFRRKGMDDMERKARRAEVLRSLEPGDEDPERQGTLFGPPRSRREKIDVRDFVAGLQRR